MAAAIFWVSKVEIQRAMQPVERTPRELDVYERVDR